MWNILLNGQRLDVLSSWQPSFSRKNNAFAFGALELARTLSFTLPATPKNNTIFASANDWHTIGAAMRVYHDAHLYGHSVSFSGRLYVEDADRSGYKCVFAFGDLERLKALSDVKKLDFDNCGVDAQLRPLRNGVSRSLNNGVAANSAESLGNAFVNRLYTNRTTDTPPTYTMPSVRVADLFANLQTLYGLSVDIPAECADLAVVLSSLNGYKGRSVTIAKTSRNAASVTTNDIVKVSTTFTDIDWIFNGVRVAPIAFKWFELTEDAEITFPASVSDEVFICDGRSVPTFYGGYSFNTAANVSSRANYGKPLAGRKVKLTATDADGNIIRYGFFTKANYQNQGSGSTLAQGFIGGADASPLSYAVSVTSTATADITRDHNYWLRDNYPQVGFVDLLKTIAAVSGKWLYIDGDTIRFAPFNLGGWSMVRLDKVLSVSQITRRFGDFGQSGVLEYDSADSVSDRIRTAYAVDNETLTAEKVVLKIPFSEGDGTRDDADSLFVDDFFYDTEGKLGKDIDKDTLSHIGTGSRLARTTIPAAGDIQALCDTSTAVEASVSMTAYEFARLKENNTIYLGGSLWVWLSASWAKDVCKISLQRLA